MEKACKYCGAVKPIELFQKHPRAAHGRTNKCKACACESEKQRYRKNHEKIRARIKELYQQSPDKLHGIYKWRDANMDKHKVSAKRWKTNNQERQNAYERARYAASQDMRVKAAERCRRYQISKRMATPKWADIRAMRVLYAKAQEWERLTGVEWHVDHVVPITSDIVCGLHTWDNLQVLVGGVNLSKLNRAWPDMP